MLDAGWLKQWHFNRRHTKYIFEKRTNKTYKIHANSEIIKLHQQIFISRAQECWWWWTATHPECAAPWPKYSWDPAFRNKWVQKMKEWVKDFSQTQRLLTLPKLHVHISSPIQYCIINQVSVETMMRKKQRVWFMRFEMGISGLLGKCG